jgi:dTDP-4-amino-4,6-dideoxygalactose transaminase
MEKLALNGGPKTIDGPLAKWPVFDDQDEKAVLDVLRSGKWWLYAYGGGPRPDGKITDDMGQVERFEREFAAAHHVKHAFGVTSGTDALEIALRACDIGPGDEVITTGYTFIATSSAILSVCAMPVYVDIHPESYNIDPARIEEAITPKTRAILVVHFGGEICDMDAIMAIARKRNLVVIEDACQAAGAIIRGNQAAGSIGDVGTFSFQASKVMSSGEGGVATAQDDRIADKLWGYRNCGRIKTGVWYEHHYSGTNCRMTEWQGAILRGQLRRLPEQCELRRQNYETFASKIRGIPGLKLRTLHPDGTQRCLSVIVTRFTGEGWDGLHRNDFVKALQAEGVPISIGYGWANYMNPLFLNIQQTMGNRAFAFGVDKFPDFRQYIQRCPYTERACSSEATFMLHDVFMTDAAGIGKLADAFAKVYECRAELRSAK